MRYLSIFPLVLLLLSCTQSNAPHKPEEQIPAALKDENSEVRTSSFRKSYNEDLVEELFEELKNSNAEYKTIAALINSASKMKTDSLSKFVNYRQKSSRYYSDATINSGSIKDSVLRETVSQAIRKSERQFEKRIAQTLSLVEKIDKNDTRASDLYIVLKIGATIPVIEKYQNNLDNKAILALLKKQQELLEKLIIENKKNGL